MFAGKVIRRRNWLPAVTVLAAALVCGSNGQPAAGADLGKAAGSLELVPADVAFYSAMLRCREQVETALESRAFDKLKNMAVVQMGLGFYNLQAANPDSPVGQFHAALEQPEVKELLALGADMFSNEVFFYGDTSAVDAIEIMQEMAGAVRYGPLMMQAAGEEMPFDEDEMQTAVAISVIADNADRLAIPNFVMGFKVTDTEAAAKQLEKLPSLLIPQFDADPRLEGRLKVETVAGHEYLVLKLDGEMVPWDEVPVGEMEQIELEEGDTQQAMKALRELTLVVALGIRGDYILLTVGSSTDALAAFGADGPKLAGRKEFQPLTDYADRPITSIGFASTETMASIQTNEQDLDDLVEVADELLPLAELDEAAEDKIRKDVAALARDLKPYLPDYGAVMGFHFMTDQGIEGYQYDWTDYPTVDGSRPLPLLEHVGGSPWLAAVGRGKGSPEQYDLLVKWLKVGYGYFEEYALPEMSKRERKDFRKAMDVVLPLVERVDKINRDMLIPALADGQIGFVMDERLESKRFLQALPATDGPMPMFEPALIVGVSDAKLLKKAFAGYQKVLDDVVDAIRDAEPGSIPEGYTIPRPEPQKVSGGTVWVYPMPDEWGLDEQVAVSLGLSKTVGTVTISPDHAQRLLRATPLEVGRTVIDPKRKLGAAVVFDFAALIDTIAPWIDLAISQSMEDNEFQAAMVKGQVDIVLDVLKVFRSATAESYLVDGAWVTHSLVELRDVEK